MSKPFDPFRNPDEAATSLIVRCPKCGSDDFEVRQNQYEIFRICRVKECKNRWSGGTMGAARPDYRDPPSLPGVPAPDDGPDVVQFTGAPYRRFGGGDE